MPTNRRPSPALVIALLALFLAAGGGQAVADGVAHVSKVISGQSIKAGTITTKQVKNRSLLAADFKKGQLPKGARGPQGPKGDTGTVDTSNFYTKAESDANYLGKAAKAADTSLFNGSDATAFTHGASTSVSGNREGPMAQGTSDDNFLAVPGVGGVKVDCFGGGIPQVTYRNDHPAGQTESVAAVTTGVGATQVAQNALPKGVMLVVAASGAVSNGAGHVSISVTAPDISSTIDVTYISQINGGTTCRFGATAVTRAAL